MNSVLDKTRLAEKHYREKLKKDNHQLQKRKLQQKKQYELNKKRALTRHKWIK